MQCPGQDSRYWKQGAIFEVKCPNCDNQVEFFKDDTSRKCPNCGHRFVNPHMDFGCAAYCQFAEQCLGSLPPEVVAKQEELLKDRVAIQMKRYFQGDKKRIQHANKVAYYAEKIGKEEGGDMAVILISAYLHDIGIPEAERKYNSSSFKYQHQEGPPVARAILEDLGAKEDLITRVCELIDHHHTPGENEDLNFKVVFDADQITNLEEKKQEGNLDPSTLQDRIETSVFTRGGKSLAEQVLGN